jgi:large subunit ribosomal protein L10
VHSVTGQKYPDEVNASRARPPFKRVAALEGFVSSLNEHSRFSKQSLGNKVNMATTPNAAKAAVVTEVKQMLSGVDAALITEYRGLSVGSLATLRRALRPLGAEYKVYKNTLASRAAQEAGFEGLSQFLVGPTAITFVKGDASAAAKALRDHAKTNPLLVLKGGVVGGKTVSAVELKALADLPPREVLLAQFAGMLQAPLNKTANLLQAPMRKVAYGIKALIESKDAA